MEIEEEIHKNIFWNISHVSFSSIFLQIYSWKTWVLSWSTTFLSFNKILYCPFLCSLFTILTLANYFFFPHYYRIILNSFLWFKDLEFDPFSILFLVSFTPIFPAVPLPLLAPAGGGEGGVYCIQNISFVRPAGTGVIETQIGVLAASVIVYPFSLPRALNIKSSGKVWWRSCAGACFSGKLKHPFDNHDKYRICQ